jgi:pimeloyl-ACP methyl ester carboxylesterase
MADPIAPWPGALVALDIGDVFVRTAPAAGVAGVAEPALFVHGLGGSSRNWTDIMDLLSRPDESVGQGPGAGPVLASAALDLPGFGYSPVPANRDYSIDACVAAVVALIDKRGRWPVHLVGNSLGGAVCTRVAARRPDLVRTLTLISPALPDLRPRLIPLRVAAVILPGLGRRALARLELVSAQERTVQTIRDLYVDPTRMHPDRIREEVDEVTRRDGLGYQSEVLIGSARALVTEYTRRGARTLWRDAARVTAPTLVIHGSHDRLVNPVTGARAARVFPSAHVVVLPRIGHVAMMERPDLVARVMRGFFALADTGRSGGPTHAGQAANAGSASGPGELNQVPS